MVKIGEKMSDISMYEDVVIFPFYVGSKPLSVPSVGISYCDENYWVNRKDPNHYSVEYVMEGKGFIRDEKLHCVKKGDIFIARAHTQHHYYADKEEPFTKIWFLVIGEFADYLFDFYGVNKTVYPNAEYSDIFFELFHLAKSGVAYEEMCRLTAINLHKLLSGLSAEKNTPVLPWLKQIKERLDGSLKSNVSIDALATEFGISKSQLIRGFKKQYGETPYSYFLKRKLDTANSMLRYTGLTIKQIAIELQFADEFYFSNLFKKTYGVSPQKFRKSWTSE